MDAPHRPLPFGDLLKRYRDAAGLTQEELAERARLSVQGVASLERGLRTRPQRDTVRLLAEALELEGEQRAGFDAAARQPRLTGASPRVVSVRPTLSAAVPPLVGRHAERALVERHLAGSETESTPPLLILAGEPGIGKTRLLQEAVGQAARTGWTVLRGGCQRRGGQDPFAPILEAVESHLFSLVPTARQSQVRGCAWLVRLLPELAEGPIAPLPAHPLPPAQEYRLVVKAVQRLLANAAGPAGTLLVLDDLQWAGTDALDILGMLVRADAAAPLRVIAAYRATEVPAAHPLAVLLADLAHASLVTQCALAALAPADAAVLLGTLLHVVPEGGAALSAAAQERILRQTNGVPFFLVSAAQDAQTGIIEEREPRDTVPWVVAHGVRQRMAALPPEVRDLLGVAAVVGREAPRAVLIAVSARAEEDVLAVLETACYARLLEEVDSHTYRFAHDVIREVVEADLSAARRMLLHRRVAEALREAPGESPVEAIAYHYGHTDEHAVAALWCERAGDRAAAHYANATALAHYAAAREHLIVCRADPPALSRLAEKIGDASMRMAQYAAAGQAFEQARLGEEQPARRVELWRKEGASVYRRGQYSQALALFAAAEREAEAAGSALALPNSVRAALYVSRGDVLFAQGDHAAAHAVVARAVALLSAEPPGQARDLALADAEFRRAQITRMSGDLAQAAHWYRHMGELKERARDEWGSAWSWWGQGLVATAQGDLPHAAQCYRRCEALMERTSDQFGVVIAWMGLATVAVARGALSEAEEYYRRSLASSTHAGDQQLVVWSLIGQAQLACERGDLIQAVRTCQVARRLARRIGVFAAEVQAVLTQAQIYLRGAPSRWRHRAAVALAERGYSLTTAVPVAWAVVQTELVRAELAWSTYLMGYGSLGQARQAANDAVCLAESKQMRCEQALAWRLLGQCTLASGDLAEAEAHLRTALAIQQQAGAALAAARTRLALAEALAAPPAGNAVAVRPLTLLVKDADAVAPRSQDRWALLAEARAQFVASGAALDVAQADDLAASWQPLQRHGARGG